MTISDALWRSRAATHVKMVKDAWTDMGWYPEDFSGSHFKFFGSFTGIVLLCQRLEKEKPEASKQLRDYLINIPGIRNVNDLLDSETNNILAACEQLDVLVQMGQALLSEKNTKA